MFVYSATAQDGGPDKSAWQCGIRVIATLQIGSCELGLIKRPQPDIAHRNLAWPAFDLEANESRLVIDMRQPVH